ncbi:MAG: hypothetical protein EXR71_21050 [Myxococcales bacterium]|nr:hypothetical protein [Myxococcales bacterium]
MLWRAQVAAYADVKSLDSYCAEWYYSLCLNQILPTQVKNIGTQKITSIKVSKVRAQRYMGNASQTLWGIWRDLPPGAESSVPSTTSPPVKSSNGNRDLSETWEFYRVEWLELGDGTRLSYGAEDYREAARGTLTFTDVRAARERGGMSTKAVETLFEQRAAAGYPGAGR